MISISHNVEWLVEESRLYDVMDWLKGIKSFSNQLTDMCNSMSPFFSCIFGCLCVQAVCLCVQAVCLCAGCMPVCAGCMYCDSDGQV